MDVSNRNARQDLNPEWNLDLNSDLNAQRESQLESTGSALREETQSLMQKQTVGVELLNSLLSLTGLPESRIQPELKTILEDAGQDPATITIEGLRAAMLAYLETCDREMTGGGDSDSV